MTPIGRGGAVLAFVVCALANVAVVSADALALNIPISGTLVGQTVGTVANYPLIGDGNAITIVLRYIGGNPISDPAVGFIIFSDSTVVANQTESGSNNGTTFYTLATTPGMNYNVQVYNYLPGFSMSYQLLISDPNPSPSAAMAGPQSPCPQARAMAANCCAGNRSAGSSLVWRPAQCTIIC